jgi:hypothetical protein
MKTTRVIFLFCTIAVACAAQSPPLSTPKQGSTETDESKAAQKPAAHQRDKDGAEDKTFIINQVNTSPESQQRQNSNGGGDRDLLLAWFTGLLVFVGLLQVGALVWQVRVLNLTLQFSGNTAQRQLGAYVGVSSASARMINKNTITVVVMVKNFGETPARKVRISIDHKMAQYPLKNALSSTKNSGTGTNGVVFPGIETWAQHDIDLIKEPIVEEQTIFIYGKIFYEDIFKRERWTEYRYFFPAPKAHINLTVGQEYLLSIDSTGNGTEE